MKAELNRLGADNFEALVQALISGIFGHEAKIYGDGPDGQREAVIENADSMICGARAQGRTIVQAKYKSPDGDEDNWHWLHRNLKAELEGFREKAKTRRGFIPDTWLFFTNLALTPVLDSGLKDKADAFVKGYTDLIPHIYILGADEIRAMLDNNRDVARRFNEFLMSGDVLKETMDLLQAAQNETREAFLEYLRKMFREDSAVRLEQADGDAETRINIRRVYTDLEVSAPNGAQGETVGLAAFLLKLGDRPHRRGKHGDTPDTPGDTSGNLVLLGDAGQGKSTLCQYVCQLYRAALLRRFHSEEPGVAEYFAGEMIPAPACERFPALIRLRDYAKWLAGRDETDNLSVLAYLQFHILARACVDVSLLELRKLLKSHSWIFFFDGLDEVPVSSNRSELLRQIHSFLELDLCAADCDALVICTSRPQGYDEGFPLRHFRHMVLQDMSPALCRRYIDRLLVLLEENTEERERCRAVLEDALSDATTAKLMTTPLYTAILVLLVTAGKRPPKRRFELFEEYCGTVVRREQRKALLPALYEGDEAWIVELHAAIAYRLQRESETVGNAAAEIDAAACCELIGAYLAEEDWDGNRAEMTERLYTALTRRLPFLAETPGTDGESHVAFPLRSMQEYFAAQQILDFDEEKQREVLETISLSAYWRNVYLFVAGYYSKEAKRRRNMCDLLYVICLRNNGDPAYLNPDREVCRLTLAGSRLALDILGDDLFYQGKGQERYLELAAKILPWHFKRNLPQVRAFRKLPVLLLKKMLDAYYLDIRSADEIALLLLWETVVKGDVGAREKLEIISDTLQAPMSSSMHVLLDIGSEGIGDRMLERMFQWCTQNELHPAYYNMDLFTQFLKHYQKCKGLEPQPIAAKRRTLCWLFLYEKASQSFLDELKQDAPQLEAVVRKWLYIRKKKNKRFDRAWKTRLLQDYKLQENAIYHSLSVALQNESINELSALFTFLQAPSFGTLQRLLQMLEGLPEGYVKDVYAIIRKTSWPLSLIATQLEDGAKLDDLLTDYYKSVLSESFEREEHIITALYSHDLLALTEMKAWREMKNNYPFTEVEYQELCEIAETANQVELNSLSYILYRRNRSAENLDHVTLSVILKRFSVLFDTKYGTWLALKAFASSSPSELLRNKLDYPSSITSFTYQYGNSQKILRNIHSIIDFDATYLDVYALIPWVFKPEVQKELQNMAKTAANLYPKIRESSNRCVQFGCLLLVLTTSLPSELLSLIQSDIRKFPMEVQHLLRNSAFCFSLDSLLLLYEYTEEQSWDEKEKAGFQQQYRAAMLAALESRPAAPALGN